MHSVWQAIVGWDRSSFIALNHGRGCKPLDHVMPWLTDLGLGHVQALLLVAAALIIGWRMRDMPAQKMWVGRAMLGLVIGVWPAAAGKLPPTGARPWWFSVTEHAAGRNLDFEPRTVPGVY